MIIWFFFVSNLMIISTHHYPGSLHQSDHWRVRLDVEELGPSVVVVQCIQIFLLKQLWFLLAWQNQFSQLYSNVIHCWLLDVIIIGRQITFPTMFWCNTLLAKSLSQLCSDIIFWWLLDVVYKVKLLQLGNVVCHPCSSTLN